MSNTDDKALAQTAAHDPATNPQGMADFDAFAFSAPQWTPEDVSTSAEGETICSNTNTDREADKPNDLSDFDDFAFSGPEWRPDGDGGGSEPEQPIPEEHLPAGTDEPALPVTDTDVGQPDSPEAPMSLMDHLNEMRTRLVRCCIGIGLGFLACWSGVEYLFDVLVAPLLAALPAGSHAQYLSLPEAFFTRMYIAFVAGVFAVSPYIFYQIWAFIAPGLYDEEKRYVIPIAVLSAIFFIGGGAFCYFIVFPYAFNFFVSFSTAEIAVMPKISEYLGFVLKLLVAFGLIFEMPLFALFLSRMGIISAALMRKTRRYAILVIFIVAAILTPPDVVSQLLMAGPMLILYEFSILVAAAFGRRKDKGSEGKEQETDK